MLTLHWVNATVFVYTGSDYWPYVMIESTLQFDAVGIVPDLLPFLWVVQRSTKYIVKKTGRETAWEWG